MLLGLCKAHLLYPLAERLEGRAILPKLAVLRREAAAPFPERKARLRRQLADILAHAGATVPYYRELFADLRFDPACVLKDERRIEALPTLTKDTVREQGARMLSETADRARLHERKTGSSTGPAARLYYDQEGLDWTAAENIQMLQWAGKSRHQREAHLSTRFATPIPEADQRREARKCFVLNRANVYTDDFSDAGLAPVWEAIKTARARLVQGHPSTMEALAGHVARRGIDARGAFALFESTGEMLTGRQRAAIEAAFGCRVLNRYGAAEFGVMAQELFHGPADELLVADSLVYPEVLPLGPEALSGEAMGPGFGELAFTGLRNRAMPLIRYRMGDMGSLTEHDDGWRITGLMGRVHDVLRLGGRVYPTHYVQDVLDRTPGVENMQILTRGGEAREVRLVVPDEARKAAVLAACAASFPGVPCRVVDASELVFSGWRAKFRYVLEEDA